jgi:ribosome biogenesis GTPase / thiamine phosphate phosphatase
MEGIIIKIISDNYTVKINNNEYVYKARGKFRNEKIILIVGDKVIVDLDKKIIVEVLKRKNQLIRPLVSNVDQVLIVISCKNPNFSSNLLDKLLIIIEFNNIKPIICFTKYDLLTNEEKNKIKEYIEYYRKIGYKVLINNKINILKKILKDKITVLAGQSGVGKSTLLNYLDKNLNLKTDELSKSLKRGKNTTRHVELFNINGGFVADTPGFSCLDFIDMTKADIRDNMIEFNKYKYKCKYKDCYHLKEDDCYIKKLVNKGDIILSRYNNYKKFINSRK